MGLQSALSTALTGMNGAETIIDVAGNNVANSQTVGFKESGVNFATQFLQTISIGSPPSAGNGGTNPRQIGLGAKVAEIAQDFTQGTIEISSNPLDVAIQGDGFLIVRSALSGADSGQFYTRNGQLKINQDNQLVTTSGDRVLGWNAVNGRIVERMEPLVIPIGGSVANNVTSVATFSGTLDPNSQVGVGRTIQSNVLGNYEIEFPNSSSFDETDIVETPDIAINTMAGADGAPGLFTDTGIYLYKVVFLDLAGNESAPSGALSVNKFWADDVNLTGIPTSGDSTYVNRRIYRKEVGSTEPYRLVGEIADGTTNVFTDGVSDASLLTQAALNEDTIDTGAYSYYITYRQSGGDNLESRPSPLVGTKSITEVGNRIRLKELPQPDSGSGFDQIRIYRNGTGANSGKHFLVDTVAVGTATYIDSMTNAELITQPQIDLDGVRITEGSNLSSVQLRRGSDYVQLFQGAGTLKFVGTKGDIELPPKELTIHDGSGTEPATTVQEWLDFMEQALGFTTDVPDAPSISIVDGRIQIVSNAGVKNAIDIDPDSFVFTPTGGSPKTVSIPFTQTRAAAGEGSTSEFVVYDSLGNPLTVRLTTVLEEKNDSNSVWRWIATSADNEPALENGEVTDFSTLVGTGTIVFDKDGDFDPELSGETLVIIQRNVSPADTLSFDLDFSGLNGKSQGRSRVDFETQDGFAPGVLTDFNITESGEIRGVYSNGISQTLGQILMASFRNNNGLEQVGNNLFAAGVNSGTANIDVPGEGGLGELTAGAVELSNTDIGQNLIDLILASTQYRGGARVITAVQELLDELMALQR